MRRLILATILAGALAGSAAAAPAPLERKGSPTAAIADSIKIPPGSTILFLAGSVPSRLNPDAPAGTPPVFGDTKAQATSAFKNMEAMLKAQGMTMGDVVMMRVFVVADPAKGAADFAGMNEAYRQFFGTADQPNKPARMSTEVKGLANPGWLIEIDAQAAKAGS